MLDAVIIGGGITGLVLAERLGSAGNRFMLLERGQPGGVIKTVQRQGFLLEQGPSVFLDKAGFSSYLERIGLGPEERVYPRVRRFGQYIWHRGRPEVVPNSLRTFLSTPLFGFADKMRLATLPLKLWRRGWLQGAPEDESVALFLARFVGARVVTQVVDPALKGIYGGNAVELSARSTFPLLWSTLAQGGSLRDYIRIRRRLRGEGGRRSAKVFVLRGGCGALPARLLERIGLGVIVQTAACKIRPKPAEGGFEVLTDTAGVFTSRQVYIATSGAESAAYLSELDLELGVALRKLSYASIVVVHCAVARPAPLQAGGFGVLFPEGGAHRLLGVMYNSELFPHVAPAGYHLLTVCLGGVRAADICNLSDTELGEAVRFELWEKLGISCLQVLAVQKWERAIPQYEVGHFHLEARMQALERRFPGLYFVGVDRGGISLPDRVSRVLQIEVR